MSLKPHYICSSDKQSNHALYPKYMLEDTPLLQLSNLWLTLKTAHEQ